MKNSLWIIIFLVPVFTAAQGYMAVQANLLEKAYQEESDELLLLFFDNWADYYTPNITSVENDTIAEAYKVFEAFYQPLRLDLITKELNDNTTYINKPFFIVQGTLRKLSVADKVPLATSERFDFANVHTRTVASLIDFRPDVYFKGKRIVYLTPEYHKLLDSFMLRHHVSAKDPNMLRSRNKYEQDRREYFISRISGIKKRIISWDYVTGPCVSEIVIDSRLEYAVVLFSYRYSGYEAKLQKRNGEWVILDITSTWIE